MKYYHSIKDPQVVRAIKNGAVAVLPTDTVYGLVASALNPAAAKRLYKLKSRDHKPGTVIAANCEQLIELGLKSRYLKAVRQFWPGPVSVIIPCGDELNYLHLGSHGLAVRIPSATDIVELLKETGPLLTSSANLPGMPPANTVTEAERYFGAGVEAYIDGGDMSGHAPSTVIRIVDDTVEVVREGAVKINDAGTVQPLSHSLPYP